MGFKVEEVLVRVKDTAILHMYGFRDHINPTLAKDVPNDPFLLVFKATWLGDCTLTHVLAPTGPRFGWNWFAMAWDTFIQNYVQDELRVRPLGTTRQVLDDQVVYDYRIPKHVMKVPNRMIRQRQRRDARINLRSLLNKFCDRMTPQPLLRIECYDSFGERIERNMRKYSGAWVQNLRLERRERIKGAVKTLVRQPWHFERAFKFSAEPLPDSTPCEIAEENKTDRIDSSVGHAANNGPAAPTGPAAPPVPEDAAAGLRTHRKLKIKQKFDLNLFKKGRPSTRDYQLLDGEGPAGPEDRPLLDPSPQQNEQAQEQQA
ncbi:uncharacterized protein J3D65DRAFT_274917 [Phyllosticta citribraziliensis]|uniref:Uncharacterized protein n=1 Tax=Phyllosticta citribraziliensis TaxID=989973 RepID=A0ABR1LVU4_9PEZI